MHRRSVAVFDRFLSALAIMLDKAEMIRSAEQLGVTIVGVSGDYAAGRHAEVPPAEVSTGAV